ncbi:MAG TPA: ankyrin repeat domain-containing protein, partial [Bryobacteraceae bacterium]|nr:ankyrin repeat domain-containing protein [Bryobacteraceae bacterium]
MSRALPAKPNLEFLRKQAKELLQAFHQGDPAAIENFRSAHAAPKLAGALHVLARDYGFPNWPKLKDHVESLVRLMEPAVALSKAVCASDAAKTARVLEQHPELKARLNEPMFNYDGMQALLAAVQRSDRGTIDVLLQSGADINARSHSWAGGIGVLDECGPAMAPFLIERGATLDTHAAARLGMFDKLQEMVASDPDVVFRKGANGQTPLHLASTVEIARYLVDHGAAIDARDLLHESTPAQHMLRVVQARHYPRDRQDIARFLVARGCLTDILMAAALGDHELTRRLLDRDPECVRTRVSNEYFPKQDPRSSGSIYYQLFGARTTPHMVARDFGHEDIFRLLMERSPEDLKTAQAFELGDETIFGSVIAARPDFIATLSDAERRRLPDAAQNNNVEAVRLMLAAGWPVDAKGEHGLTALDWGAWHGNAQMIREVLRHHPQLELKD